MRTWISLVAIMYVVQAGAFIDNRFFIPYIATDPYFLSPQNYSYLRIYSFASSAYEAYGAVGNEIPLFDFAREGGLHQYDQREIDRVLQQAQLTDESLFPSEWANSLPQSPWRMDGHIETQGVHIDAEYPVTSWLRLGGNWYFMHVNSRLELFRDINQFNHQAFLMPGNDQKLHDIKAESHDALGLKPPLHIETEPGDLDLYARFSWNEEYAYKFQYIDLGIQSGLLFPTSEQRDIDNPASIPVGGNNHAGIYVTCNPHVILKDNIRAGWDARVIKRFSHTMRQRMPIGDEPILFGAAVAQADVDPGVTVGFAPYLAFEELREGFGLLFRYTVVGHTQDRWSNIQLPDTITSVDRSTLRETSSWGLEHVTAQAFYDFGHAQLPDEPSARLIIKAEAPVEWLVSQRAVKTYGLSVALEGSF